MDEAQRQTPEDFVCFNDFFTRELKENARPISEDTAEICSPADGAISQLGEIKEGRIFQAKGQDYSVFELLGGDAQLADTFKNGQFATVYLSPKDYHRVHMPISGTLQRTVYVPGDLFSVNQTTAENVPRLFSRNERLIAIFDTEIGPLAMVMVGAMIVAGIETVFDAVVTPPTSELSMTDYSDQNIRLNKGDEMGRFMLGSTVVLCFAKEVMEWLPGFDAGSPLLMGQGLGQVST